MFGLDLPGRKLKSCIFNTIKPILSLFSSLTWEQYLKDQAIYIIATRPNISVLPIQKTEWFNRMKNHISGTELRESGLNELTADQSDAKSDTSGLSSASIERLHICSGIK